MIFEESTPLFNLTELNLIKSSWEVDTVDQKNYKDETKCFKDVYLNNLPQEYVDRFLDWIESKIEKKIHNRKKYNFILKIMEEGDHFDYHTDTDFVNTSWEVEYAAGFHINDDYGGGEFVVYENGNERIIGKQIGIPYIFSSDVPHKINKIKSKIRYSIIVFIYNNSIDKRILI
tara:strand:- start:123 stop:644 length:522 start_codon:yes stop_codon:yes gene_type:complete